MREVEPKFTEKSPFISPDLSKMIEGLRYPTPTTDFHKILQILKSRKEGIIHIGAQEIEIDIQHSKQELHILSQLIRVLEASLQIDQKSEKELALFQEGKIRIKPELQVQINIMYFDQNDFENDFGGRVRKITD